VDKVFINGRMVEHIMEAIGMIRKKVMAFMCGLMVELI
jgi:hypothetical protein